MCYEGLFTDAEGGEDGVEDGVGGDAAGDAADVVDGGADIFGQKVRRD